MKFFFLGILFLFFSHTSFGAIKISQIQGISLNADNVSRDYETKTVILEGHVDILIGDTRLTCDNATIHLVRNEILATGNVVLVSPLTIIEGTKIRFDYKTGFGSIENGFVQSGQVVFEGKHVEKTGEKTYVATDARFTSCKTCPPAWSFSGTEIEAEIGGYAYIKYPVLRIMNFPIFILPRILIPLKSDRQSGLLVPSFKYSRKGGAAISQGVFWAINKSQDATYTLTSYTQRGVKNHLEYRYVLTPESHGLLQTGFMKDRAFTDNGKSEKSNIETINRSFLHYEHHYEMPDRMTQRVNLNWVADLRSFQHSGIRSLEFT